MSPVIKKFAKAPAERLDYTIDYAKELTRLTDTIVSSVWIVPSNMADSIANQAIHLDDGVTLNYDENSPSPVFSQGGVSFTDSTTTIYLSGGTLNNPYIVESRITTAGGRRYARRIQIAVQNAA